MPRVYKRKSFRASYGDKALQDALQAIRDGEPLRTASKNHGIPCRTLRRHRDGKVARPGTTTLGRFQPELSVTYEAMLVTQIQAMEKALFGLTTTDVRRLAYDFAEKMKIPHRFQHTSKMAGKDWFEGFRKRHPQLSIRKPEATNIARAVGFNREQTDSFFKVYREVLDEGNFSPQKIWNMDETGITNVQKPSNVVATKGSRAVGKMTSGERGKTTTVLCAMNAAGTYIPPMFIFARKRFSEVLLNGGPAGCIGTCTSNGWSEGDCFMKWLRHFVLHAKPTQQDKHILILDGHQSHKTLEAVDYARENGIIMITLPPHTTHRMQPLDVSYFQSCKAAYNRAADNWMVTNAGRRISQFDVVGIFATAYEKTATMGKAINGFRATGLWPFNDDIFSDEDFVAANLIEEESPRPDPTCRAANINTNVAVDVPNGNMNVVTTVHEEVDSEPTNPQPGTSKENEAKEILSSLCTPPKHQQKRERKRKMEKASVITSSPYKLQLLEKKATKRRKIAKNSSNKKAPSPLSSDDEEWPCLVCGEPFANSRSSEIWVQCMSCRNWAHEECSPGTDMYICQNCDSDC